MALFHSPSGMKTRAQLKKELASTGEKQQLEVHHPRMEVEHQDLEVQTDVLPSGTVLKKDGGSAPKCTSSRASSSAARLKQQLEYETAQAKSIIELNLARKQAEIEKELLDKKLAVEIADLESSRKSVSSYSNKGKVEDWLERSAAASGSSHCCFNESRDDPKQRSKGASADTRPPHDTGRAIAELSTAIRDAVTAASGNNNNKQLLSRLATSKDLPLYFGDPLEFLHLKEAYHESTRLCKYSDQENLWRLRRCLRGEAKEATSALMMSATSPQEIIDVLELKSGSKDHYC